MTRINIRFRNPERVGWIAVQRILLQAHSCETFIELRAYLESIKDEVIVEYLDTPLAGAAKISSPRVEFEQLRLSFTPEIPDRR